LATQPKAVTFRSLLVDSGRYYHDFYWNLLSWIL